MPSRSGPVPKVPEPPEAPLWRVFRSEVGPHVLLIPQTRLFDVSQDFAAALGRKDAWAVNTAETLAMIPAGELAMDVVPQVSAQAISINVSSRCNLACAYCYAGGGGFGGAQISPISWETTRAAVDRLLTLATPGVPVTIGFMGGEPFLNRTLLHRAVTYAIEKAVERHHEVRFSVTTNGTLLNSEDIALLRSHPFAVTVSIDGGQDVHDAQRPSVSGRSSYARLREAIAPLLADPGQARVAARATVSRTNLELQPRFEAIVDLGFPEVGFSPVRTASGSQALASEDWPAYLSAMVGLARQELNGSLAGAPIRLTNFAVALKQLHRGASQPYPCSAGGGYFSVAADGRWYACHRAIGQEEYALGDNSGLDQTRQFDFLRRRHVHAQPECRSCWARYLCSGGCHHEASSRSESSCGFIRGWLDFCLAAYCELSARRPNWFSSCCEM